jgi:hypothetical protein
VNLQERMGWIETIVLAAVLALVLIAYVLSRV